MNQKVKPILQRIGSTTAAIIFVLMQIALYVVCLYFWRHLPPPGWSMAIVAFVAAAMSIHPDIKPWHKAAWMVLIGGFLVLEFKSIAKDRLETEQRFAAILKTQNETFRATSDGIKRAIANVTGGDSFVYIGDELDYQEHKVASFKQGDEPLYNVSVVITTNKPADALPAIPGSNTATVELGDYPAGVYTGYQGHGDPDGLKRIFDYMNAPGPGPIKMKSDFHARNGEWTQEEIIALDPTADSSLPRNAAIRPFLRAIWVYRKTDSGSKMLYEKIDPQFPADMKQKYSPKL